MRPLPCQPERVTPCHAWSRLTAPSAARVPRCREDPFAVKKYMQVEEGESTDDGCARPGLWQEALGLASVRAEACGKAGACGACSAECSAECPGGLPALLRRAPHAAPLARVVARQATGARGRARL